MDITVDTIIARYNTEIAQLMQRAIFAEARAEAAEAKLAEAENEEESA